MQTVKIGEEFSPSKNYKTLLKTYATSAFVIASLFFLAIVLFAAPSEAILIIACLILVPMLFVSYWIPEFYRTMRYKLTKHEMVWRRGVWFHDTGIVPYNRITNIDIKQGPVSRMLGISALKIQTAGYSGPQASSEITIEGVEKSEDMREMIMKFVRGGSPTATESHFKGSSEEKVLDELVKIRKLLSKK